MFDGECRAGLMRIELFCSFYRREILDRRPYENERSALQVRRDSWRPHPVYAAVVIGR